jgi:hypothetical protein
MLRLLGVDEPTIEKAGFVGTWWAFVDEPVRRELARSQPSLDRLMAQLDGAGQAGMGLIAERLGEVLAADPEIRPVLAANLQ